MNSRLVIYKVTVALIFSLYLLYGLKHWKSKSGTDFYQAWLVGQAIHNMDLTNAYDKRESARIKRDLKKSSINDHSSRRLISAHEDRKKNILNNTPLLYAVIYLFSTGDYDTDYERFRTISLLGYTISLFLICHLLGYDIFFSFVFLIAFTQMFWPFKRDVDLGNVTQIQFGLMALYFWLQKRPLSDLKNFFGGFVLGFSLLFKPIIMYSVLLLILKQLRDRDFKQSVTMGMGGLLSLLVSIILPYYILGPACTWKNWLAYGSRISFTTEWIDDSLIAILFKTLDISINWTVGFAMTLLVFIFFTYRPRIKFSPAFLWKDLPHGFTEDLLLYGTGTCIYFLSAPMVHGQYILLCVPILLLTFRLKNDTKHLEQPLRFVGLVAFFMIVTHPVNLWHYSDSLTPQLWNYAAVALLFFGCMLGIYALNYRQIKSNQYQIR